MFFKSTSKVDVGYFIESRHGVPEFLIQPLTKLINNKTGCPSVSSLSDRIYGIHPFISFSVKFKLLDNGDVDLVYKIDESFHTNTKEIHDLLKRIIHVQNINGSLFFQLMSLHIFITDDEDLEIVTVNNEFMNVENCYYVSGSLLPGKWPRQLNCAYGQIDPSKYSVISFDFNKPMLNVIFSKNSNVSRVEPNEDTWNYYESIRDITTYLKNIKKHFKRLYSGRPKKLL